MNLQYMSKAEALALQNCLQGLQVYGAGERLKAVMDAVAYGFASKWYVDGAAAASNLRKSLGDDNNDGMSAETPFRTMAKAFTKIKSGDVIFVHGKITEQIIAPLGVFDVTIIGIGNRPRHDNAHWAPAATAVATPNLVLREQGWSIYNMLWDAPDAAAAIQIRRDESATYPDGSHATIVGNIFLLGGTGIEDVGGMHNCLIEDNRFEDLTNGIKTVSAGVAAPLQNVIRRNHFVDCTNAILIMGSKCLIVENWFGAGTVLLNTKYLADFGGNIVAGNYMNITTAEFAAGIKVLGATADYWNDNHNNDTAAVEVGIPAP